MKIGYARTSTTDQVAGLEDQIAKLKADGCEEIFSELNFVPVPAATFAFNVAWLELPIDAEPVARAAVGSVPAIGEANLMNYGNPPPCSRPE